MKVVVTGGSGYLGSVLVSVLIAGGWDVTVVDWGGRGWPWHAGPPSPARLVRADIRTINWTEVLDRGDSVVHLAALVGDPACSRDQLEAESVNHVASLRLASAMAEIGASHLIFASTCSNYGARRHDAGPVDEDVELAPLSRYAETKVAVETHLLANEHPFSVDVLRFATLFGLSPAMRFDLTVNEFTRDIALGRPLVVFAPESWRPYVHTHDASRVIARCLESPPTTPRVLNVGSDRNNSTKLEIVSTVQRVVGHSRSVSMGARGGDGRNYKVSFNRLYEELGLVPTTTVEYGVREIIDALSGGEFDDPFAGKYVV